MNWEVETMKSKASYFSISKPLMIENLRRFWAIPVLAFLAYFLSGVFPLLMTYSHLNGMADYIELSLNNQQPFYMFAHLIFPIFTAVVIFRYLQGISSVSVMHSMPFTRAKLYNTGFLSGLILIITPILVNGLILLAVSKPAFREYGTSEGMMVNNVNVFTRADVLNWIWISILIVVVVYAISVFAGIITGNALMHFATALFFNFVVPGLYGVFIAYFSHYLYGFDISGNWLDFCVKISPYLDVIKNGADFGAWSTIYYIANVLILYFLSGFFYQKRKLEHATDSLAFGFMEPIICYLVAFLGMTLLGFYFQVLGKEEFYMYAGLAAGTVIFFIIGQMIVKKTPRIFNRSSLKSFGVYVLIAALFLGGLVIDITGFEKRVPAPQKVSGFVLNEDFARNYNVYGYRNGYSFNSDSESQFELKDPKNIEALTRLHRSIIESGDRLEDSDKTLHSNVQLIYDPETNFPMSRRYQVDYDFFANSKEFKQIYESKEFKELYSLRNLEYEKIDSINFSPDKPLLQAIDITNPAEIQEFMECLEKDFDSQTFEDIISLKHSYATANINYSYKDKKSKTPEQILNNTISYKITENYKNSIQWLKDHNFSNQFELKASDVDYIEIIHYTKPETKDGSEVYYDFNEMIKRYGFKTVKITDPERIQDIITRYDSQTKNYEDYISGMIYFKGDGTFQNEYAKEAYPPEQYAKEYGGSYKDVESEAYANPSIQFYLNEGNIPEYIQNYFAQ